MKAIKRQEKVESMAIKLFRFNYARDLLISMLKNLRHTILEESKASFKCSTCGIVYHSKPKFCSNCGLHLGG